MATRERFGLSAALTTPFDAAGGIDVARMVAHARSCIDRGCHSVTLFGTTGEGASIGAGERTGILAAMRARDVGPERIVWAVAAPSPVDAAAQARAALDAGVRNVLLPPPFYFKGPSIDGLHAWYARVFADLGDTGRDVLLYHIPSVTEVPLPLDLVLRLARDFPKVLAGLKDSGCDWSYTEPLLAARGDLAILVGDERDLARAVRAGGEGAISGMANVIPGRLLGLAVDGRDDPAVNELVEAVIAHPVTPAVKALVAHLTGDRTWLRTRPPLQPVSDAVVAALAAAHDRVFPVA